MLYNTNELTQHQCVDSEKGMLDGIEALLALRRVSCLKCCMSSTMLLSLHAE